MNGREPFPKLEMRPVSSDDLAAIIGIFRRLSRLSAYRRFFTVADPAPFVERHLELVDHRDHEAIAVFDGDEVVGIAQWDRRPAHSDEAEIAITVDEAWQHRGLGRALIRALAGDAQRHGIGTLSATVLWDNPPAVRLASGNGPDEVVIDGPETQFRYALRRAS